MLNLREIQNEKDFRVKRIQKRLAQTESRIMMEFDSPHILKCYESFENSDLKLMIIEYCNEGTLK